MKKIIFPIILLCLVLFLSIAAVSAATHFTNDEVINASGTVKNYVENYHKVPKTVNINGTTVNNYTYLYCVSTVVQNVYNNNTKGVDVKTFNHPQSVKDSVSSGAMGKAEYIHIADQVKVYMDQTGYVPGYAYDTSLGTYYGYENMIYTYSKILFSYQTTNTLPNTINVRPWKFITNPIYNNRTGKRFNSIQAAINDANTLNSDYIKVEKGIYTENVVVNKKITLIPVSGAIVTLRL